MPRPQPPEQLFPVTYRLTRKQRRKVREMGGVEWLRKMISSARAVRLGRSSIEYIRATAARDRDIVTSPASSNELAKKYNLSASRVRQIRQQHREA